VERSKQEQSCETSPYRFGGCSRTGGAVCQFRHPEPEEQRKDQEELAHSEGENSPGRDGIGPSVHCGERIDGHGEEGRVDDNDTEESKASKGIDCRVARQSPTIC
jgi:hypothetical protein